MFTHSIRWRLQFWLALLLTWVLSGFAFGVYQRQRIHLLQQTDQELEQRLAALSTLLRGRPGQRGGRPRRDLSLSLWRAWWPAAGRGLLV